MALLAGLAAAVWVVAWLLPVWRGDRAVDPTAFWVGPVRVRWYGLIMALAFLPAWAVARPELGRLGLDPDRVADALIIGIPLGLAGARLGFVLQNLDYFAAHPVDALRTWQGGLSIHGAMAGIAAAVLIVSRRFRVAPGALASALAPSLLLGQAVGRWGNFFNRELLGYPTGLAWGLYVPPEARPPAFAGSTRFHPAFLYESVLNALGAWWLVGRRRRGAEGELAALYLVVYSFNRFLVEFVRIGEAAWLGLTRAQWVSVGLALLGAAWWLGVRRPARTEPAGERRGRGDAVHR